MKKFLLAGFALTALSGPVLAADLPARAPVYKAPPPAVEVWSWSGFYIGANIGYSWGRSDTSVNFTNGAGTLLFASSNKFNLNGVIGGGQIGVNWQNGNWVLGIEADIQGTGQKGSFDVVCPTGVCAAPFGIIALFPGGPVTASVNQKLRWLGTVRGRLGVTLAPTVLAYVTGGLAVGGVTTDIAVSGATGTTPVAAAFSSDTTKAGWTVGGGLEARLGGNWTGKVEYLYVDLRSISGGPFVTPVAALGGGFVSTSFNSRITDNIVRVGLNYKFGPGPVVASY